MTGYYEAEPDYAVPTGEYIAEWLEGNALTQTELAQRLGVSRKHLNRVIAGAPLTPDLAARLEMVTHVPARRWLALEATYRADVERLALEETLARRTDLLDVVAPLASALRKQDIISATRSRPGQLVLELMAFFRVGDVGQLEARLGQPAAAFRQSAAHEVSWPSVAGWLRLGEIEAEDELPSLPPFDPELLQTSIPRLRDLTCAPAPTLQDSLSATLRSCGVVMVVVPEVPGSRAYGATRWFGRSPVIQLSLRRKDDGNFWFTVFHELGHVLLHPRKEFVDGITSDSEAEEEADTFARNTLIPVHDMWRLRGLRSLKDVEDAAEALGVSPGVVVGRLHHEGTWPPSRGRGLYKRLQFAE